MPPRKAPPVSLAPVAGRPSTFRPAARSGQHAKGEAAKLDTINGKASAPDRPPHRPAVKGEPTGREKDAAIVAGAAVRKFQKIGHRASAAPTPERILRAGGAVSVEVIADVVEVSRGDQFET